METKLIAQLEKKLFSTNFKKEEFIFDYILTPQEEKAVVDNKLTEIKKHAAWKMWDKGLSNQEIDKKMLEIDWEVMIDKEKLLDGANQRKHFSIQEKELVSIEREKERKAAEELKLKCDANFMFNLMAKTSLLSFGKKLIVNDDTSPLIRVLCFFLSGDQRFEIDNESYSLKKGLWLRGVSGLGKTHLVNCLKDNPLKPINIYSMVDIYHTVKDEGFFNVDYSKIIYMDDVGTEENPVVKCFGTEINYFKDFIESYYLNSQRYERLIVSTNNSFEEIERRYGHRVRSRIKEMFNIVDVTGKDLRG